MTREFIYIRVEVRQSTPVEVSLAEKLTGSDAFMSLGAIAIRHVRFFCESKDKAWNDGHALMGGNESRTDETVMNDQLIEL